MYNFFKTKKDSLEKEQQTDTFISKHMVELIQDIFLENN